MKYICDRIHYIYSVHSDSFQNFRTFLTVAETQFTDEQFSGSLQEKFLKVYSQKVIIHMLSVERFVSHNSD